MILSAKVIRQRLLARTRVRHLQVLLQVAELGSVRKAADAIGMTQPAVTHVLADLESLLGSALFQRHARGMRLSPLGAQLLPVARRVLGAIDDAAEQAAAMGAQSEGVVRVAAIGGAIAGLLVQAIPAFGAAHPALLVQLQEAAVQQIPALLARGDVDLALCREPPVLPEGWQFTHLFEDRFVVVAGPQHPLVRARRIDLARLAGETWLALPSDTAARHAFDGLFGERATPPVLRQVSTRVPAMLWALLTHEPVLALVPASVARQFVQSGQLVELGLAHPLPFDPIGMLSPAAGLPPAAAVLADFLQQFPLDIRAAARKPRRATARSGA